MKALSQPLNPAAEAVFALLPPVMRWACEDDRPGPRFDLTVPAIIAGRVVATDGRVCLWMPATPEIEDVITDARNGLKPFPNVKDVTERPDSEFGPELPTPDLSDLAPCPDCKGERFVPWVLCYCCGEKSYLPGTKIECGECEGTGFDPDGQVSAGPLLLAPRYAVPLIRWGAIFRLAIADPEGSIVRFTLPEGIIGALMPLYLDHTKKQPRMARTKEPHP